MNLTKSSEQASRPWKSIKIKIKNSFQIASEQFYLQETHDHRSIHIQICSSPEANPNANQQTPRYKSAPSTTTASVLLHVDPVQDMLLAQSQVTLLFYYLICYMVGKVCFPAKTSQSKVIISFISPVKCIVMEEEGPSPEGGSTVDCVHRQLGQVGEGDPEGYRVILNWGSFY